MQAQSKVSRYRPPRAKSSPYITGEGARALRAELQQLWKIERPQVTQVVHEAAKNGDRSENGDYIYGKRRLREIDSRVRYLTQRIDNAVIIEDPPRDPTKVFFAAWVKVEDAGGETHEYRLVGADEIGDQQNYISIDSPIAKALLGKSVDDSVDVSTPSGARELTIIDIRYPPR